MKKGLIKLLLLVVFGCATSIFIYYSAEKATSVNHSNYYLEEQNKIEEGIMKDTAYTYQNPKIIVNPYKNSPLTALIIFETNDLTAPTITIHGKDKSSTITNTFIPGKTHILPVYGLYANTENKVTLKVNNNTIDLKIKTSALPQDLVLPSNVKSNKTQKTSELYFITPLNDGYTVAYDVNGDVRWYLTDHHTFDVKRLNNGHLLLSSSRLISSPNFTTGLVEMDLIGKVYFEYTLPGGYHDDVYEMDDGNLLTLTSDLTSNTISDKVVLLKRDTGKIIKEWNLKEILPTSCGLNEYATNENWFNNNAIWYDKNTNSITLSGQNQDAIVNLDFTTGELNWIIGDPTNWNAEFLKYFFTAGDDFKWQYAQSAVEVLPDGNILILDNGKNRSKVKSEYISDINNYSRAVIYKINTDNMIIEQVFEYGTELGTSFYSSYTGDVDYLDKNHYLILSANNNNADLSSSSLNSNTTLIEVQNDKVIFELNLPTSSYHAEKLNLYANNSYYISEASIIGNMGETVADKNISTFFNKAIDETYKSKNIKIYKEMDRLVFTGSFDKTDSVSIILDGVFNNKTYNVKISENNTYKFINDVGMKGKYYIYVKINDTVYDPDLFIQY